MAKTSNDELKTLLKTYDTQKGKDRAPDKELAAEEAWVAKFVALRDKVIRPTMEELGKELQKHGHDFNIVEKQFRRADNRATPEEASIRIDIYLSNERTRTVIGQDRRPHVALATHHRSQMVQLFICDITSRGGVVSKVGDYPLERVDAALIRDKFVALFKRLLGTT